MEKEKNNRGLIALLVIFIVSTLVLGGYLVYDKVLSKENSETITSNQDKTVEDKKEDNQEETTYSEEYFNNLLETFLPNKSASNFVRNITNFTNDDISLYLFFYYVSYANNNNLAIENSENITYNVNKSDIDDLVYKVFGKSAIEYEISESKGRTGIKKIDDNTYQVYWFATGWSAPSSKLINIKKLDNEATAEYELTDSDAYGEDGKIVGTLKFYLNKNGEDWNVTKIEYIENK